MEFCLRYSSGPFNADPVPAADVVRMALHPQIAAVCRSERFASVFVTDRDGARNEPERPPFVEYHGRRYWFLVSQYLCAVVDLRITLLLPQPEPWLVGNGGQLAPHLATLLDALRVPTAEERPEGAPLTRNDTDLYCLLEHSNRIDRLHVEQFVDNAPESPDAFAALIRVRTRITRALWGNISLV